MQNQNIPTTSKSISWTTQEFEHHPKTPGWYIGFTVASAILIVLGFISGSILTVVLFCLIVVLTFGYAHRKPRILLHQITNSGIVLGDAMHPYKEIKKFWIVYNPPQVKILNIETTAYLNRLISIQMGEEDPIKIKEFLKQYIAEDLNREESLTDVIARYLRI